jgi:response regulator RpfG family c-di-GMP phosphodiesterase
MESQWPQVTEEREDLFAILRHQGEVWNGTGHPEGLAGPSIPLGSRILALAETCDMEIFVGGRDAADVVAEIQRRAGVLWDPDLVHLLAEDSLQEMVRLDADSQNPTGRSST